MSSETTLPASAMMSAPELYALLMAGYQPLNVVIGVSAVSMGSRGFGRSIRAIFTKGEMVAVSQTATEARKNALKLAQDAAAVLGADLFLVNSFETRDLAEIVEITCVGTALKKAGEPRVMTMATATN